MSWSSISRISARETGRSSPRWCTRCARPRSSTCACSCSIARIRSPARTWRVRCSTAASRTPAATAARARRTPTAIYPIPMRHGLTMGELARFYNDVLGLHAELARDPHRRLAARGLVRSDEAAVDQAVAQHAESHECHALSRRRVARRDEHLRRPRNARGVSARGRAVDQREEGDRSARVAEPARRQVLRGATSRPRIRATTSTAARTSTASASSLPIASASTPRASAPR